MKILTVHVQGGAAASFLVHVNGSAVVGRSGIIIQCDGGSELLLIEVVVLLLLLLLFKQQLNDCYAG